MMSQRKTAKNEEGEQVKERMDKVIIAVIFDMDGVLIDSEEEYLKYELAFVRTKNPNATMEQLYGMVGSSREDAWACVARAVNNGQTWEELRKEYQDSFQGKSVFERVDYTEIFCKEAKLVLEKLRDRGYALALASSTQIEVIQHVLRVNHIEQYFQVVVSGTQFKRSKPDPEIYHFTSMRLGVREEECFVVEDSTFGVTAASRAGMTVAAVIDDRFGFDQSLADYRIRSLTEILEILP